MKYKPTKNIFLLVCLLMFTGNLFAAENDDSGIEEFWQEAYVFRNFFEKWRGEILFNNLYSQSLGNYDWFLEGKLFYSPQSWLGLEILYRHEFYDLDGVKVQEYRPMFRITGKKQFGNWKFRNRHRFEFRMFEVESSQFRYRSDLKIKADWSWTSMNINPYIMEEIFVVKEEITRNRIYVGFEAKKGKLEPAVYALVQSDRTAEDWQNRLIVGIVLGIEL